MDIAIVAPSPVPFQVGGAEKLWLGMAAYVNENTDHRVEVIKIPVREDTLTHLLDAYERFNRLDVDGFDLVITGKYPAWAVTHRNHLCYMLHPLRGLYDHYPVERSFPSIDRHPVAREVERFLRRNANANGALASLMEFMAKKSLTPLPPDLDHLVSPLGRRLVRWLDRSALAQGRVAKLAAISRTVADRYRPIFGDRPVQVAYPPPTLDGVCGRYQYFFTASRFDQIKRVELLIQAMQWVDEDVELRIAGTGPAQRDLEELAAKDERVKLLGFLSDADLRKQYQDALAVPFVPKDEDLGLVALEAMACAKAVITTTDSGGPIEVVRNGKTGLIVEPSAKAIGKALDELASDPRLAERLGSNARKEIPTPNWGPTVAQLLKGVEPIVRSSRVRTATSPVPRKFLVCTTFPVYPPRNGGQLRVYNLAKVIARNSKVEIVSLGSADEPTQRLSIADGVCETRVAQSEDHRQAEWDLSREFDGIPVTDIAFPKFVSMTPGYIEQVRLHEAHSDVLVACHPYVLPVFDHNDRRPVWYEAQDVEIDLKRKILTGSRAAPLLEVVRELEQRCCKESSVVSVCSVDDKNRIVELSGVDPRKVAVVPNGFDVDAVEFVSPAERLVRKRLAGLENDFICIFVGSYHGPNLAAADSIRDLATELPDVDFVVLGSAGWDLQGADDRLPENLAVLGSVDDACKSSAMTLADLALNPVPYGSGTNLKMIEYCAAGLPVLSTEAGARGMSRDLSKEVTVAELEQFAESIARLRRQSARRSRQVEAARKCVLAEYDWEDLVEPLYRNYLRCL